MNVRSKIAMEYKRISNIACIARRFLGLLRNQIGAIKEILKGGRYQAAVAIVTSQAASSLKKSADTGNQGKPSTPLLDSLGDLQSLGPLQCATLPRVHAHQLSFPDTAQRLVPPGSIHKFTYFLRSVSTIKGRLIWYNYRCSSRLVARASFGACFLRSKNKI